MQTNYHHVTVVPFISSLRGLLTVLQKTQAFAQEKGMSDADVLDARLAPDMFSLVKQVQIASDSARNTTAQLAGIEKPVYEDTETTIAQLVERTARTIAFLESLTEEQFAQADTRQLVMSYFPGKYFKPEEFVAMFGLPNFYFHVVTAYGIMRHLGVQIGKQDYLGQVPMYDMEEVA
jgi:hypothetical protein